MTDRPGSAGERELQHRYGTAGRAEAFYGNQVLGHPNERMAAFVARMEMAFVSTADANGHCDCSVRCGPTGFIHVLSPRALAYPEYRGNGVMASLGNVAENGHVGLLMVDFLRDCVGLHVNGRARVVETADVLAMPGATDRLRADCQSRGGRRPERWVLVDVDEAYVHCAKHLPMMATVPKKIAWGTDDPAAKGGDYFGIGSRPAPSSGTPGEGRGEGGFGPSEAVRRAKSPSP